MAAAPAPIEIGEGGFMLVGGDASSPGGLGRPLLIAGRYPAPGSTDEIMVNERAADEYGFEIGTRRPVEGLVSIESFERVQLGDAEVVGIVRLPFDLVDDPSTDALAVAGPDFGGGSLADAAEIGTILWLRLHDPADAPGVISELSRRVERGDVETTGTLVEGAQRAVELQRNGLLIAAGWWLRRHSSPSGRRSGGTSRPAVRTRTCSPRSVSHRPHAGAPGSSPSRPPPPPAS